MTNVNVASVTLSVSSVYWRRAYASTLIATGDEPRRSIGTVNLTEFFVTMSISAAFIATLDLASYGKIVLGLIIGGALAAPLAGWLVRILPPKTAMLMVGIVVTVLSLYNLGRLVI